MIVLSGADLVLPDRILPAGTLTIDGDRIAGITSGTGGLTSPEDLHGHYILPGFIDVHVHGVAGADTLDDGDPLSVMAAELPRFGVTAFCPRTSRAGSSIPGIAAHSRSRASRIPHASCFA